MGEIEKWKPKELTRNTTELTRNDQLSRRISEALEMERHQQRIIDIPPTPRAAAHSRVILPDEAQSPIAAPPKVVQGDGVVFLVRVCAVVDQKYLVRYVRSENLRYRLSGDSLPLTKKRFNMSFAGRDMQTAEVPCSDFEDEECCFCGASGRIVWCPSCKSFVCRGRVVDFDFFKCRLSCGSAGRLTRGDITHNGGIVPSVIL